MRKYKLAITSTLTRVQANVLRPNEAIMNVVIHIAASGTIGTQGHLKPGPSGSILSKGSNFSDFDFFCVLLYDATTTIDANTLEPMDRFHHREPTTSFRTSS